MGRILDKISERRRKQDLLAHDSNQTEENGQDSSTATTNDTTTSTTTTTTTTLIAPKYYSFEFFPPKTEAGMDNLVTRMDRMVTRLDPLFVDVTWSGSMAAARQTLALADHAQKYLGVDVLVHLTVANTARSDLRTILDQLKASGGVRNILALRGDPPRGRKSWKVGEVSGGECDRAIDLVRLIRQEYGEYFGIAVAGHPEGHPSSTSPEDEIRHLKAKMDAGADFILTQFFYDVDVFVDFVTRCRAAGIEAPILPGILPIQSYSNFVRMTEYCGVRVPQELWDRLEPVKGDDEATKEIGCEVATEMCQRILDHPTIGVDGVHFYTLNLERSVTRILTRMGAVDLISSDTTTNDSKEDERNNKPPLTDTVRTTTGRPLPWRQSAMTKRSTTETVRPINWANRPKSYVMRTEDWDEFPNGRWGDATSPAFGELSNLSHFYSFSLGSEDDQRAMLGHDPRQPPDVYEVFARYVEGRIPHIPWCETPLQPESFLIQDQLAGLNRSGFLTINSQPAVNGIPSVHKIFGWGGPGGYVYQKSYCECFCSPENARRLGEMVKKKSSMNLYAVSYSGDELQEGTELGGVTALTWGVFPNREILQPTIFDPSTFLVWAEEAFSLWTSMWLPLYDYETASYDLIESIRDTYYLCAIIDNDFISSSNNADASEDHCDFSSTLWQAMLEITNDTAAIS